MKTLHFKPFEHRRPAGGRVALAPVSPQAGVRVCTFPGSPSTALDQAVAREAFKTAGIAAYRSSARHRRRRRRRRLAEGTRQGARPRLRCDRRLPALDRRRWFGQQVALLARLSALGLCQRRNARPARTGKRRPDSRRGDLRESGATDRRAAARRQTRPGEYAPSSPSMPSRTVMRSVRSSGIPPWWRIASHASAAALRRAPARSAVCGLASSSSRSAPNSAALQKRIDAGRWPR